MTDAGRGRRIPRRRLLAGGAVGGVAAAGGGLAAWLGLRGGSGPATPESTLTPAGTPTSTGFVPPTPIPTPTPRPTQSPTPVPSSDLIEETSGEWAVQQFAPGEAIAFNPGICFMQPDGNVTCYLYQPASGEFGDHTCSDGNRWILREAMAGSSLYDRQTGREFTYPNPPQGVVLLSYDYLLFASMGVSPGGAIWPPRAFRPYFVVDANMRRVAEFDLPDLDDRFPQRVWKRGPGTLAYAADRLALRALDLATGAATTLFEPPELDGYSIVPHRVQWQPGTQVVVHYWYIPDHGWDDFGRPRPEFPFRNKLVVFEPDGVTLDYVSDWTDGPLYLSPDGRYVAIETQLHEGTATLGGINDSWPMVTIHDARGGEPIFRVRSLAISSGDFLTDNRWLADSSGVVAARKRPGDASGVSWRELQYVVLGRSASMSTLPESPDADAQWFRSPRIAGPVPAPFDTDLFSYGRIMLLRRSTNRFVAPSVPEDGPVHLSPWGSADANEMRFAFPHGGHGGGGIGVLLPPKLEYPPFDDSLPVQVAVTGTCLNLREAPSLAAPVLECLEAETVLTLDPEPGDFTGESPVQPLGGALAHYNWQDQQSFARVRTDDGEAGWVALQYLEWA